VVRASCSSTTPIDWNHPGIHLHGFLFSWKNGQGAGAADRSSIHKVKFCEKPDERG